VVMNLRVLENIATFNSSKSLPMLSLFRVRFPFYKCVYYLSGNLCVLLFQVSDMLPLLLIPLPWCFLWVSDFI
jgi:hypothetical protein